MRLEAPVREGSDPRLIVIVVESDFGTCPRKLYLVVLHSLDGKHLKVPEVRGKIWKTTHRKKRGDDKGRGRWVQLYVKNHGSFAIEDMQHEEPLPLVEIKA